MEKIPKRRFTDKIRLLADEAWELNYKNVSEALHAVARIAEKEREDRYARDQRFTV